MSSVILAIDDDHEYRRSVVRHLRLIKYGVLEATSVSEALAVLDRHEVDLIILETALGGSTAMNEEFGDFVPPGSSGLDLLEVVRSAPRYIPVIILTNMDRTIDELAAIRGGADSFLRKPAELNLLTAYVRSNLRRANFIRAISRGELAGVHGLPGVPTNKSSVFHAGDLTIDTAHRLVRVHNGPYCHLSEKEIGILTLLASAPGKVFSKRDLIRTVWHGQEELGNQAVEATIKRIRKKIEPGSGKAKYIVNARGMGYRFIHVTGHGESNPYN
jgi:two-component system alkaline phosphatase synthesis response regulator PhoP